MTSYLKYLLDGGDWACAWAEQETLAEVCHHMAPLLSEPLRMEAQRIEHLLRSDYREAMRLWARLSDIVRYDHTGEIAEASVYWPLGGPDARW